MALPGLLQHYLLIPDIPWVDISIDFTEGWPKSNRLIVIWVIVDRLTKYVHFIALKYSFTAIELVQVFITQIYKLHGFPSTIVSDRDKIFISPFWHLYLSWWEPNFI